MKNHWSYKKEARLGSISAILLIVLGGGWATTAQLSSAVIGSGEIIGSVRPQIVQHRDGGVITDILVHEGQSVNAGDPVIRLDGSELHAELTVIENELAEVTASIARLEAEQDEKPKPDFSEVRLRYGREDIIEGQLSLFLARKINRLEILKSHNQRKKQTVEEIAILEDSLSTIDEQISLVRVQRQKIDKLVSQGYSASTQKVELQLGQLRLQENRSAIHASVARQHATIAEIDAALRQIVSQWRESLLSELRDKAREYNQLQVRASSLKSRIAGLELKAPVAGVVHDLQVHAINSVIRPAEPVLWIVPGLKDLVARTRIDTNQVDQIEVGQDARLKLGSIELRHAQEIAGTVIRISADRLTNDNTGESFYSVEIAPQESELTRLEMAKLTVGMPVDAFIETESRTPLQYLLSPVTQYFERAFKES